MSNFAEEYAKLNTEQKQAVSNIDGPVLVVAGPGTGKTQLLSVRAAHIISTTDTPPEAILCLTYTDSGARAMRERMAQLIGPAAYDVQISTYHAFGSELIRRYGEYFSEDPGTIPVDELGIDRTLRLIFDELPYTSVLKSTRAYLDDIKTFIADCKRALLKPDDIRALVSQNQEFISAAAPLLDKHLAAFVKMGKQTVGLFQALHEELSALKTSEPLRPTLSCLHVQCLGQLHAALRSFDETGKTTNLTSWKNVWLARSASGGWVIDGDRTNRKLLAAADIYEQYIARLEQAHQYDYDDMIMRAIRGLETNADLRYTLQERYFYIMLDEFQDTNPAQLRLIQLLTDNPVHEGKPNVLAVGDDDQAIYAFQGADYSNMMQFASMYRDVKIIPLVKNYRSHKHVLHVAHNIAEQIEHRLHHSFTDINKLLSAENKKLPPKATIARHEFRTDAAQYEWVAGQIENLIKEGTPLSEIAVLAPKHMYLEPLVPFLRRRGIPIHYDKRENVLDEPIVKQLTRMCELVLALADEDHDKADELWPEILSYPFWGLSTSSIWGLSWQARDLGKPWAQLLFKDQSLKPVALFFKRLSLISRTEALEKALDHLIGIEPLDLMEKDIETAFKSPLYDYYFDKTRSHNDPLTFWQTLLALTQLREKLRNYKTDEERALTIQDFTSFVEAYEEAGIVILNNSPYHEADEAVQLMTAYKAKGQEFDKVFVLACVDEVWGSKARNRTPNLVLPPNLAFIRYAGASNDERLRLLFVALTRAKTCLYLTSYASSIDGRALTRLKYLSETDAENGRTISPWLPENYQRVNRDERETLTEAEIKDYWHSRHIKALESTSLKNLLTPRIEKLRLSATHLNSFIDLRYGGPEYFYFNTILKFPKSIGVSGQFGNAIHETLLWLHNQQVATGKLPETSKALKAFEAFLVSRRLSKHDHNQQLERGRYALENWLRENRSAFNPDHKHEVDFRTEGVMIESIPLTGMIDKLVIDKTNKTMHVVDFKTGKPHRNWRENDIQLHKYRQQLYFYKLLVEHSHSFKGYKVVSGSLHFIEPNSDGLLLPPLELAYDDKEMERIKKLLSIVWQHIQGFNFPDVKHYGNDLKSIIKFEDDLIAGII